MQKIKNIHIFGGGTVAYIANHLALSAPAYGTTARKLDILCQEKFKTMNTHLELTSMASGGHTKLNTIEDISNRIDQLVARPETKIVFFSCAIVDYTPSDVSLYRPGEWSLLIPKCGKYNTRIDSSENPEIAIDAYRSEKIISKIRKTRKDIFLIGFKTTCGADNDTMYRKGLKLCKEGSCNLVLVNDAARRFNMIITPEEAAYCETHERDIVLAELVEMTYHRSHLTFTQSTVVDGRPVPWNSELVPNSLRTIVDYCIQGGAYKPFGEAGSTVGHFAHKLSDNEFLTSIRKSNFNDLDKNGLVYVRTDGPDSVIAYGAKPSVGGQSQRIIFRDHEGMDCVVHFHCPRKSGGDDIPTVSQREVECGSHECGAQTSNNLKQFGNLKAVMLSNHGPNIVFNKNIDPQEVINFINKNFALSQKTGGYNLE